ncbi:MAG: Quinone oxidoreductase 1 [Burkholderia gladioli]|nr:MAG: Quinone oxidoreductase 1 [Burkholderia gladioli]
MPKAIRYDQPGGPEVMKWVDVEVGEPKAGEVRVKHHAVGLNYIDVYFRTGLYPQPLPGGLGQEGAGEVVAVGEGVAALKVGDRVAYTGVPPGSYAEERVLPAEKIVRLPDAITYEDAASIMLQGLTAQYLLRRTYPVKAGDTILIHAVAGGVGLIVCQWAKALGATVIGTVGSDEKAELARAHGCDHTIVYTREPEFAGRVKEITNGAGVPVVYDSIGKDTYIARRSTAWRRSACSSVSAMRRARCSRSTRRSSPRAARCSSRARRPPRSRSAPHHGLDDPAALTV